MAFGNINPVLQQFSFFRRDYPPADLAQTLARSNDGATASADGPALPARIPDRRSQAHHPALRGFAGVESCPVMNGNAAATAAPADVAGAQDVAHADQYGVSQILKQLSNTFWKTLGWNTSAAPADSAKFNRLEFAPASEWPAAAVNATEREKEILSTLVGFIEKHAAGIYENVLEKFHQAGKGVTESEGMLDPALRAYAGKPGGMVEEVIDFLKSLSPEEYLLVYATLAGIDKKTSIDDNIFKQNSQFDLADAAEKNQPIVDYYLAKRLAPDAHKVPGQNYEGHPAFMKVKGLRPNTKLLPIAVTQQITYHAPCAVLLNMVKLFQFPKEHDRMDQKFEKEKLENRKRAWEAANSTDPDTPVPRFMPDLSETAFDEVDLPEDTKIVPALIGTKDIESAAAVAIHPENNRCLTEFCDYTENPSAIKYIVSDDRPPMGKADDLSKIEILENKEEALAQWRNE